MIGIFDYFIRLISCPSFLLPFVSLNEWFDCVHLLLLTLHPSEEIQMMDSEILENNQSF